MQTAEAWFLNSGWEVRDFLDGSIMVILINTMIFHQEICGFWLAGAEKSDVINKWKHQRRKILKTCGDITQQI